MSQQLDEIGWFLPAKKMMDGRHIMAGWTDSHPHIWEVKHYIYIYIFIVLLGIIALIENIW